MVAHAAYTSHLKCKSPWPSKGSALKPNGRKRIADQTEMLLSIAGNKSKETAAKLCASSRWLTFSQKNEAKLNAGAMLPSKIKIAATSL